MTRYKQADFVDEDNSSIGSIHLNETSTNPAMHIRYHTARVTYIDFSKYVFGLHTFFFCLDYPGYIIVASSNQIGKMLIAMSTWVCRFVNFMLCIVYIVVEE